MSESGVADNRQALYDLIDKIDVAIMTTRSSDGTLVSRPMQTQRRDADATLWFMTNIETHKVEDLEHDPEINLNYYDAGSREWVSLSGTAIVSSDRARIREMYKKDWKAWFEDQGGNRDGGPEDPRIALIAVRPRRASYFKSERSAPLAVFEIAKASITGGTPDLGEVRNVDL